MFGKGAVGSHVAGKGERDHWLTVIQNPRRVYRPTTGSNDSEGRCNDLGCPLHMQEYCAKWRRI